jgi:hypothetical protein
MRQEGKGTGRGKVKSEQGGQERNGKLGRSGLGVGVKSRGARGAEGARFDECRLAHARQELVTTQKLSGACQRKPRTFSGR